MTIFPNLLVWLILGIVLVVMVLALLWEIAKQLSGSESTSRYRTTLNKGRYKASLPKSRVSISQGSRGDFGKSWETDIRLTYKRYREIYPFSKITYREYKELQRKKAFRRAVSSQKIKRMVR